MDQPLMPAIVVRRTTDFATALEVARDARLEIAADAEPPIAQWGAFDSELMVGTASLDEQRGLPVVGRIAVNDAYRGQGHGGRLLAAVEDEARRRGETVLWATARAPAFFIATGYSLVSGGEQRELLLADCVDCGQRGAACHPQAVRKILAT